MKINAVLILGLLLSTTIFARQFYDVKEYGAKGDGTTKDTQSVQKTIDACNQNGGGTVYFSPGTYLLGSLHLKDNVALHLEHGATLLMSTDENDFDPYETLDFPNDSDHETSFFHNALIWGEDVKHIAITGSGIIDANRKKRGGPKPIALKRCKDVIIKDITILNSPNYCISMLGTDYVNIDGVTLLNGYCDGIDPDACKHVRISNCHIETWDDAIVPKASFSLGERRATEFLTVTNCQLATNCNAFKLGTESGGDFKYITFSNSVIFKRDTGRLARSGISLESVDGSNIDGVTISNISIQDVQCPIFLRLGNRGRDMETPVPGTLKNVIISNVTVASADYPMLLAGIPDHPVENVILDNIKVEYAGGGTQEQRDISVPELIDGYPEATRFGDLPAFGLYARHVTGLKLEDIAITLLNTDYRYGYIFNDVNNLEIESVSAPGNYSKSVLHFYNVQNAFIRDCMPFSFVTTFLSVKGDKTRDISLMNNDFSNVTFIFEMREEVDANQVRINNPDNEKP